MTIVHATASDWDTYIGTTRPATLATLLRRASLDVDGELVAAVYRSTDTDVVTALAEATCEQAAWRKTQGAAAGIDAAQYVSVSAGSISLSRRAGDDATRDTFSPQAFQVLQSAGLTGQAPSTGWE
jgi:hypothetical protein